MSGHPSKYRAKLRAQGRKSERMEDIDTLRERQDATEPVLHLGGVRQGRRPAQAGVVRAKEER